MFPWNGLSQIQMPNNGVLWFQTLSKQGTELFCRFSHITGQIDFDKITETLKVTGMMT